MSDDQYNQFETALRNMENLLADVRAKWETIKAGGQPPTPPPMVTKKYKVSTRPIAGVFDAPDGKHLVKQLGWLTSVTGYEDALHPGWVQITEPYLGWMRRSDLME